MAILSQAFVEGAHVVARVVEHQIRQATAASLASTVTPTSTADPSATPTGGSNGDKKDNTSSSSPLLFFVALGFGVVFTNLWIIVGVKYCFRYNARNRVMARLDENGEPIDLQNMPARPHRRRREKKLMTMDEVNEKFPMVKYKTWVLDRKKEGLPTAGGISAPPTRPGSVRSVQGVVPEQPRTSTESTTNTREPEHNAKVEAKPDAEHQKLDSETPDVAPAAGTDQAAKITNDGPEVPAPSVEGTEGPQSKDPLRRGSEDDEEDEDEDEDDHVTSALDPDMMGSSGDTCAICIDTLEDNDDIRGLTCGHAFHAVCLDPWLTNRRACCPLCKADYYTPKARPQPVEGENRDPNAASNSDPSRNNGRMNYPRPPARSFAWGSFREARQWFPNRGIESQSEQVQQEYMRRTGRVPEPSSRQNVSNDARASQAGSGGNFMTRLRSRFQTLGQSARRNQEPQRAEAPTTTPSQLEAGIQPSTPQPN